MSHFFIAGTDSGVGKTYVTCCLLRDMKKRGLSVGAFKPVCCGERSDARLLRDAADMHESLEQINPFYLRTFAEPVVAAGLERKNISLLQLVQAYHALNAVYSTILVDAISGWNTPLTKGETMADLAELLQLPVILVVKNQRGAASQAIMNVRSIQGRGLVCKAIVLNHIEEEWDTAAVTNKQVIEDCTGVPVLAEFIHGQEEVDSLAVLGC